MKRKTFHFASLSAIFLALSACSSSMVRSSVAPDVNLAAMKTFYIVRNADDSRNVYQLMQQQFNKSGRQATSGPESLRPKEADAVVTYYAGWSFDALPGWFLRNLVIEVRDPKTNVLIASGQYAQRIERRGAEFVVEQTVDSLFKGVSR